MKLLTKHLTREIYASIALIFVALLLLFSFFDLIQELNALGRGNYHLGYVLVFILLTMPGHIYELFPVAILIGTIFALAQMAAHSELVVYRTSGVSVFQMVGTLFKLGLPLLIISYLCGEILAPPSERLAQKLRLKAQNAEISLKEFRSGVWVKDDLRFVNIKNVLPDSSLLNISIYEYDESYHLRTIITAKRASYAAKDVWQLDDVMQTSFSKEGTSIQNQAKMEWRSVLNPEILNVLLAAPEKMSILNLYQYIQHLRDNRQKTARYEIAMWNKIVFPFSVLVMLLLALPFAAHQRRQGGVSSKIFLGIVLGLAFNFIGQMFARLGAINEWQPLLSVAIIPLLFLGLATGMLWWIERR